MIRALHHVGLGVGDLARAREFLWNAFAFDMLPDGSMSSAEMAGSALDMGEKVTRGALVRAPNGYLELLEFAAQPSSEPVLRPVNAAGITHFCVQLQRMETLYARCAATGAWFHSDPIDLGTGWLYCYARDPEGNVIELEAAPLAPPDQPAWLAHVAIATPDVERLATFYHQVMGGKRAGGQKIGPNPRVDQITALPNVEVIPAWIVGANLTLELWQFLTPATTAPLQPPAFSTLGYNHLCFEVTDIALALAVALAAGATQVTPIHEVDGITHVYLRDPDGNMLELIEFSPLRANLAVEQLPKQP